MRIRLTLAFLCFLMALMGLYYLVELVDDPWQSVGNGIGYQEFHLPDPNDVYVARMDRANANAILDSGIAQGRISSGTEKVSGIFKRYDDSINFWNSNWGNRSKVVVAINGSYFNWNGVPEGGQVTSGWYAKRFIDLGGGSGLSYHLDRTVFVGQCVLNVPEKQVVTIVRGGDTIASLLISGINATRGANQLILYTPQYDDATHTTADGVEVLVEMTRPTLILPLPASAAGTVRKILNNQGKTLIPFDHVVLSASGTARDQLLASLKVGDEVRISQEIYSYDKDCATPINQTWTKTYASVGGGFNVLREGQILPTTEQGGLTKNPRTAIAYNDQYIFFIVVDGRTQRSIGMTYEEVGIFARDTLGATWAITQDGGGSSVMVVNGLVKNHPVSLCDALYLPLIVNQSSAKLAPAPTPTARPTTAGATLAPASSTLITALYACERKVANSMMMVNVQPAQWSQTFQPSQAVALASASNIRLGPGTNYSAFANLPAGTQGMILNHAANLNGIYAKGTTWWKVAFGSTEGWVDERFLKFP